MTPGGLISLIWKNVRKATRRLVLTGADWMTDTFLFEAVLYSFILFFLTHPHPPLSYPCANYDDPSRPAQANVPAGDPNWRSSATHFTPVGWLYVILCFPCLPVDRMSVGCSGTASLHLLLWHCDVAVCNSLLSLFIRWPYVCRL